MLTTAFQEYWLFTKGEKAYSTKYTNYDMYTMSQPLSFSTTPHPVPAAIIR